MSNGKCDEIRDGIPEWLHGSLDRARRAEVTDHLATCSRCREEADLLQEILDTAPEPPPGLAAAIQARLWEEMESRRGDPARGRKAAREARVVPFPRGLSRGRAWWLSAAALILAALGVGILWKEAPPGVDEDLVQVAVQDPPPEAWLWDDGLVAGAPVFDGLSDEELRTLIEELGG